MGASLLDYISHLKLKANKLGKRLTNFCNLQSTNYTFFHGSQDGSTDPTVKMKKICFVKLKLYLQLLKLKNDFQNVVIQNLVVKLY